MLGKNIKVKSCSFSCFNISMNTYLNLSDYQPLGLLSVSF